MAAPTFTEKKQQQSRVFFDVVFDVYTWITEKELERWKQRKRISLEEKHEKFIAAVPWENEKGSEKLKANLNKENKIFGISTYDNFLVIQNGIVVVQNNGKERQKNVLHVQICFFAD